MERPRVQVNAAGWRVTAAAGGVVTLALVGALIAQTTIGAGPDGDQKDPLATLALVLAILAFLIQIFVYVFQSNESVRSVERSEELNSRTQHLLDEIKSTSQATQQVQVKQFDRLLDYVVGSSSAGDANHESADVDDGDGDSSEEVGAKPHQTDWERIARELARPLRRPSFSGTLPFDPAQQAIVDFYSEMPSEKDAIEATAALLDLPPLAVAKLVTFREQELKGRNDGTRWRGFTKPSSLGDWTPSTKRLMAKGLAEDVDGRALLTPEGRRVARMTAIPAASNPPEYVLRALDKLSGPS
jgi:hypothetical protein